MQGPPRSPDGASRRKARFSSDQLPRLPCFSSLMLVLALVTLGASGCSRDLRESRDCPSRFDSEEWREAPIESEHRLQLAEQVQRCGFIDGASKAEVRRVLGPAPRPREEPYRSEYDRWWHYPVGTTNDYFGPGDEQNLTVTFDRRGRVKRVEVSPP